MCFPLAIIDSYHGRYSMGLRGIKSLGLVHGNCLALLLILAQTYNA